MRGGSCWPAWSPRRQEWALLSSTSNFAKTVFNAFSLEQLPEGDSRYVDSVGARNVPILIQQFDMPLGEDAIRCLLFCGHLGDGKTTNLNYLKKKLGDEGHFLSST
jgi:hypothetical protein